MYLRETAPAAVNAVPLREMAAHLRMASGFADDGTEDGLLELYLRNATAMIEGRLGLAMIERPYVLQVARWDRHGHLKMPVGPIAEIDSFSLVRPAVTLTISASEWELEPGINRQRVTGKNGAALRFLPHGALAEITFRAGFGTSWNAVPDDLRQAVLLLAAHYYENRAGEEALDGGLPHGVRLILDRYAPVRL